MNSPGNSGQAYSSPAPSSDRMTSRFSTRTSVAVLGSSGVECGGRSESTSPGIDCGISMVGPPEKRSDGWRAPAQDQRHHEQDQEHHEQDPGDLRRDELSLEQAQGPGNEGDDEKHKSPA